MFGRLGPVHDNVEGLSPETSGRAVYQSSGTFFGMYFIILYHIISYYIIVSQPQIVQIAWQSQYVEPNITNAQKKNI